MSFIRKYSYYILNYQNNYCLFYKIAFFSYILYSVLPVLKFPLYLLIAIVTIYKLKELNKNNSFLYYRFNFSLISVFILILLHFTAVLRTDKIDLFLLKEINRYVLLIWLFFIIPENVLINISKNQNRYILIFVYSIIGICILHISAFILKLILPEIKIIFTPFGVDKNIFSLYCIIALIAIQYLNHNQLIKANYVFYGLIILSITNIFLFSRRGYVIYFFWFISLIIYYFLNSSIVNKSAIKRFIFSVLFIIIIFLSLIIARNYFNIDNYKKDKITKTLYPVFLILNPEIKYHELVQLMWQNSYGTLPSANDLIYNHDFSMGKTYWEMFLDLGESGSFKILNDKEGSYARISRDKGYGNFQLCYMGPVICYKKNVKYTFYYTYRIIKGDSLPFSVGWNVKDAQSFPIGIKQRIIKKNDGWTFAEASYTFKDNHEGNFYTFLNSLKPGAVVDIKSVRLIISDTTVTENFCDKYEKNNNFLGPRIDRWSFAFEYFNKYQLDEKLFGAGFNYLRSFQIQFHGLNNKSIDYPHNPFLSSLLYSGIIGFIFHIIFFILSLIFYFKWINKMFFVFIIYMISFFFVFFSGNSHFSVPIFIFLSFLPFFISSSKK